jgi:hypothetical protein
MQLDKGRKSSGPDTRNEEKFRFPPTEEIWEVSCARDGEGEERGGGNKKADLPAFAQRFGGSAVA